MHPLDDPRHKVARARYHIEELEAAVRAIQTYEPRCTAREFDAQHSCYIYRFEAPPPVPPGLGLVVGDIVPNLRSALDHLAWQLASWHTRREPYSHTIFPIRRDGNIGAVRGAIRDLPPAAQEIIEGMQPYQRPSRVEDDPLWVLHDLWNTDKHRRINVVGLSIHTCVRVAPRATVAIDMLDNGEILIHVPLLSHPQAHLEPQVRAEITLGVQGERYRKRLSLLRDIHDLIRDDVLPRFAGFFP